VAQVTSVEEIDSVKLYKCKVDVGSGVTKQVMAGLKQHMAKEHLLHSLVVVITNLKAAKLAGEISEAMILAAQAPDPSVPQGECVQVLQVPGEW
jgi:aminoacyl tRNA synthase complex-interacting multifunctional protein 1